LKHVVEWTQDDGIVNPSTPQTTLKSSPAYIIPSLIDDFAQPHRASIVDSTTPCTDCIASLLENPESTQ
jgi:hypothetical protein